ncbi:restriction endonuclease [Nocardia beijingensis]|uniref:restriction endonuclease n=1 Tax=Nocardia beijingensis TaxID=95162 RepID=UPI003A5CB183
MGVRHPRSPSDSWQPQSDSCASEFEEALAALCRRDGCTDVQVVGGSGDLGTDVVARAPDGPRIVLQAKLYRNEGTVGSQDVQRFDRTAHHPRRRRGGRGDHRTRIHP